LFDRSKPTTGCSANGRRIYIYILESRKSKKNAFFAVLSTLALDKTTLFRIVVNNVPSYATS
jgi:hypothetical protein